MKNDQQAQREVRYLHDHREELAERIAAAIQEDGTIRSLPGVYLSRTSVPFKRVHSVVESSVAVIAQGCKEVLLGENRYHYDPSRYLITTVELPRVSQVLEASKACPYLALRLELDPALVNTVLVEAACSFSKEQMEVKAIDVSPLDGTLLDAFVRLIRLLDTPAEVQVLLPLITREIIYRLLMGEQGPRLRYLALPGGYTPSIATAVKRLRQDFDRPVRIEQLAQELDMSVSGFHHHFKIVTAMSPLQFQKRLRLQEARRLMLSEDLDAASAAYRVGYQDASHFNREYKSLFGVSPMRDVQRLREETSAFPGQ